METHLLHVRCEYLIFFGKEYSIITSVLAYSTFFLLRMLHNFYVIYLFHSLEYTKSGGISPSPLGFIFHRAHIISWPAIHFGLHSIVQYKEMPKFEFCGLWFDQEKDETTRSLHCTLHIHLVTMMWFCIGKTIFSTFAHITLAERSQLQYMRNFYIVIFVSLSCCYWWLLKIEVIAC